MRTPIQRKPASYQPLPGIHDPIVQRAFQGVNTLDPLSIGDNFATTTKNLDGYPFLETRKGFSALGSAYGSRVIGIGTWKDQELHAIFGDGTWRRWTGTAWSAALVSGLDTTKDWTFTNFKGNFADINLIASNGSQARRYDGSTVTSLTTPANMNYIETFTDRLFGAVGATLHFTGYRNGNDWSSAPNDETRSGFIVVETPDGENIVGVQPGIGHLTVFKRNSIHELYGYSPESYEMRTVTLEVGAINDKSIINIGGTLYFIHDTGIYRYQGGVAPSDSFSLPVSKYIKDAYKGTAHQFSASTDGHKLYFAIPEKVLVYDLLHEIWMVYDGIGDVRIMFGWNSEVYIGSDKVYKPSFGYDGVLFEWTTKPFSAHSLAQKVRCYRMYVVADVPTGSVLNIQLSKSIDGEDWENVHTALGASHIQKARIMIPITTVADANWVRVRFAGVGYVKIHEFVKQFREMPLV